MITYVCVGNSDDKLTQAEWADFVTAVDGIFGIGMRYRHKPVVAIHGRWFSAPDVQWQSACWCIEVADEFVSSLKDALGELAAQYRQDSIAWAPTTNTEFLHA